MADFTALERDLLAECDDDHVGLWSVIGYVADEMKDADEKTIRQKTLDLLFELLKAGKIQAGFPDSNGRDFHPWPFDACTVCRKIESLWKLDNRPKPGEVVWFTTPSKSLADVRR